MAGLTRLSVVHLRRGASREVRFLVRVGTAIVMDFDGQLVNLDIRFRTTAMVTNWLSLVLETSGEVSPGRALVGDLREAILDHEVVSRHQMRPRQTSHYTLDLPVVNGTKLLLKPSPSESQNECPITSTSRRLIKRRTATYAT